MDKTAKVMATKRRSSTKESAFESRRVKEKFVVLGRKRTKGGKEDLTAARGKAHEARKATLGVQFEQRGKRSAFVDRRFGEADDGMTEEEKILARFQREKARKSARGGAEYNLGDDDEGGSDESEHLLTHGGRALRATLGDRSARFTDESDEGNLFGGMRPRKAPLAAATRRGGGDDESDDSEAEWDRAAAALAEAEAAGGGGPVPLGADGRPKTRRERMAEIIAKSKAAKHEAARAKLHQEDEIEALDAEFDTLAPLLAASRRPLLSREEKAELRSRTRTAYDDTVRALAADTKVHAADRTKTVAELAAEERSKLERLERDRLRRMAGDDDDGSEDESSERPARASAAPRRVGVSAAAGLGPGGDDERDEAGTLRAERKAMALKSLSADELRSMDFRERRRVLKQLRAGAKVAKRRARAERGGKTSGSGGDSPAGSDGSVMANSASESGDSDGDGDGDGDNDNGDDDDDDDDDDGDEDNVIGGGGGANGVDAKRGVTFKDAKTASDRASAYVSKSTDESALRPSAGQLAARSTLPRPAHARPMTETDGRKSARAVEAASAAAAHTAEAAADADALPYTLSMPDSSRALDALLHRYDVAHWPTLLGRLRACHHIALGPEMRAKLNALLEMLFDLMAAHAGNAAKSAVLAPVAHALAIEMPTHAGRLAQELLVAMDSGLAACEARGGPVPWPSLGNLATIKLLGNAFSRSDARHKVLSPALLVLGHALTVSTLGSARAVVAGLMSANMMAFLLEPSARFAPEPLTFVVAVIGAASRKDADVAALPTAHQLPAMLAMTESDWRAVASLADGGTLAPLPVLDVLSADESAASARAWGTPPLAPLVRAQILASALFIAARFATMYVSYEVFQEAFAPLASALSALPVAALPASMAELVGQLVEHIADVGRGMADARRPLTLLARKATGLKLLTPVFEDEFVVGKNYDVDRERAAIHKVERKVKAERKGAMRELRRDAAFLAGESDRKRKREDEEYQSKMKGIFSILQSEQAEINAQARMIKKPRHK